MVSRFGEHDQYQSFESMTRLLEVAELDELFAPTDVPVIGDRVCIGSNLLKARKDVTKLAASYAIAKEGEQMNVFVGDFRAIEDPAAAVRLGLTKGMGLDMQHVITSEPNEGYLLSMSPGGKRLYSMSGDESKDLTNATIGTAFEPAELFAGACVFALHHILTREQAA